MTKSIDIKAKNHYLCIIKTGYKCNASANLNN